MSNENPEEINTTKRCTVPAMEAYLDKTIPILDKGFIRVIDYMGDDSSVVQAARVSYGKGTKSLSDDKALLRYLLRHRHTSPFEMCELKLHLKMPIFVARQWIRHRTANLNEYSARYSIMEKEYYIPEAEHIAIQSTDNKQGRSEKLPDAKAKAIQQKMKTHTEDSFAYYNALLEGDDAIARELARTVLPVNVYTQLYWKIDVHNLLHFLSLRAHPHAQYEIRVYAEAMLAILKQWMPLTHEAFIDYTMQAKVLSRMAIDVLNRRLQGEPVTQETSNLSKREWQELEMLFSTGGKNT